MRCGRCNGCLGRQWCLESKTEYDYCLNCGNRVNQTLYQQHVARPVEERPCLDCNKKHCDSYELKSGEVRLYSRCWTCRSKQDPSRKKKAA